jgi:MuDR family transposase
LLPHSHQNTRCNKRATNAAAAISHHFELVPVRSNQSYYTVNCKGDDFPWRLYAARIKKSGLWQIRAFTDEHTCHGLNKSKNKQANADYIANHILKKLREKPEYRPIDIQADVKRELGTEITYSGALRARDTSSTGLMRLDIAIFPIIAVKSNQPTLALT